MEAPYEIVTDRPYEVINIYREHGMGLWFAIALLSDELEYFMVDRSMSDKISQGLIFIGDCVFITGQTPDGILLRPGNAKELAEISNDSRLRARENSLLHTDGPGKAPAAGAATTQNYLPFLCDILPYSCTAIDCVRAAPVYKDKIFQGKYLINGIEVTNIKHPLPPQFVAKIYQKTRINMYPNTYNPFFFIIASSNNIFIKIVFWRESLRKYSSLRVGDIIQMRDYKHKKKLPFIDRIEYNTFTESVYNDCDEITAKDLIKIDADKKGAIRPRFEVIEGRIEYMSVLIRYNCNACLMEYVLCRIDGCCVVFFYNSDDEFYKVKEGCRIRISEVRKAVRAGFEFYLNTIYTQFELIEDDACGSSMEKEPGIKRRCKNAPQSDGAVFGAIGFIPDQFQSTSEILESDGKEIVHEREVAVNLFMKPGITTVEEIEKLPLVLNESRKSIVHALLVSIEEDELTVDYSEGGAARKQRAWRATFEGGLECSVFENFFAPGQGVRSSELQALVGHKAFFAIDSFRADLNTVLHYITGAMEK